MAGSPALFIDGKLIGYPRATFENALFYKGLEAVTRQTIASLRDTTLAGSAKRKQGLGLIASQSEIKDVKVVPHVSAVCRSGERQHPELESETIYYLGNRLVVAIGNFGHAWLQENLPISGK